MDEDDSNHFGLEDVPGMKDAVHDAYEMERRQESYQKYEKLRVQMILYLHSDDKETFLAYLEEFSMLVYNSYLFVRTCESAMESPVFTETDRTRIRAIISEFFIRARQKEDIMNLQMRREENDAILKQIIDEEEHKHGIEQKQNNPTYRQWI